VPFSLESFYNEFSDRTTFTWSVARSGSGSNSPAGSNYSCPDLPAWVLVPLAESALHYGCIEDVTPRGKDTKLFTEDGLATADANVEFVMWKQGVPCGSTVEHTLVLAGNIAEGDANYTIAWEGNYASGNTRGPATCVFSAGNTRRLLSTNGERARRQDNLMDRNITKAATGAIGALKDASTSRLSFASDKGREDKFKSVINDVVSRSTSNGWKEFSRLGFWGGIFCAVVCLVHLVLNYAWVLYTRHEIPKLVVFPRIEVLLATLAYPPVSKCAGSLISGGTQSGIITGLTLILVLILPFTVFAYWMVNKHVKENNNVVFIVDKVPDDTPKTLGESILSKFLGAKFSGHWVDNGKRRILAKYGLLFEDFTGRLHVADKPPASSSTAEGDNNDSEVDVEDVPVFTSVDLKREQLAFTSFKGSRSNSKGKVTKEADAEDPDSAGDVKVLYRGDTRVMCGILSLAKSGLIALLGGIGLTSNSEDGVIQVVLTCVILALYTLYLLFTSPYTDRVHMWVEMMTNINDAATVACTIALLPEFDNDRDLLGYVMLFLQGMSVGVRLIHQWYSVYVQMQDVVPPLIQKVKTQKKLKTQQPSEKALQRQREKDEATKAALDAIAGRGAIVRANVKLTFGNRLQRATLNELRKLASGEDPDKIIQDRVATKSDLGACDVTRTPTAWSHESQKPKDAKLAPYLN